jgi:hypothetical protein
MRVRILISLLFLIAAGAMAQTVPAQTQCCIPPPPQMTAWWTFDLPGSPSRDSALFNNAAAFTGGVTTAAGVVDRAACFNGDGAFATIANHPEINFAGPCAQSEPIFIDAWIRTGQSSGVVTILDKRSVTPTDLRGYSLFLASGRPGFQIATGPGSQVCAAANNTASSCTNEIAPTTVNVADNQWHYVAVRVSPRCGPNARGTIFVDGNIVHTFVPRQGDINNTSPLFIGQRNPALGKSFYRGCIDELEIIKRGVSDAEAFAIFNAGPRGKCKKPLP